LMFSITLAIADNTMHGGLMRFAAELPDRDRRELPCLSRTLNPCLAMRDNASNVRDLFVHVEVIIPLLRQASVG